MGGTIEVDTSYRNETAVGGPGARILVTLPLKAIPPPRRSSCSAVVEDEGRCTVQGSARVLVVDDDPLVCITLKRRFAADIFERGARVDVAPHGEAALRAVQEARDESAPFDIVTMDHARFV